MKVADVDRSMRDHPYLTGFLAGMLACGIGVGVGLFLAPPRIPSCPNSYDVLVGSGDWDAEAGRWSEYDCVDEIDLECSPRGN